MDESAARLASLTSRLRETGAKIGESIAAGNTSEATKLAKQARKDALNFLDAILEVADDPMQVWPDVSVEDVREAERRLNLEPGSFDFYFELNGAYGDERRRRLRRRLAELRKRVDTTPLDRVLSWLPEVLEVASAIAVATVIAAPVAALAAHESVFAEIVKTYISVSICLVANIVTREALKKRKHDDIFDGIADYEHDSIDRLLDMDLKPPRRDDEPPDPPSPGVSL